MTRSASRASVERKTLSTSTLSLPDSHQLQEFLDVGAHPAVGAQDLAARRSR